MSAWRRRSMLVIWLALSAYLVMSGIDTVHTHVHPGAGVPTHTSAIVAPSLDEDHCPICEWHALATSSACIGAELPVLPVAAPAVFDVCLPQRVQVAVTPRSRAPPSRQSLQSPLATI